MPWLETQILGFLNSRNIHTVLFGELNGDYIKDLIEMISYEGTLPDPKEVTQKILPESAI